MNNGRRELEIPNFMKEPQQRKEPEIRKQPSDNFYDFNLKSPLERNTKDLESINLYDKELEIPSFLQERRRENQQSHENQPKDNIIDIEEYKRLKRIKVEEPKSKKDLKEKKVSNSVLKRIKKFLFLGAVIVMVGGVAKGAYDIYQEEIALETIVNEDEFLKNLIIYDGGEEIEVRIYDQNKQIQERVSDETLYKYISEMDITEEQKQHLMNKYDVEASIETSSRSR